jgi:coenzyme F420 hydrogenase subunit beta
MKSRTSFEDSLGKSVVLTGNCAGCGACIAMCPYGCLEWLEGKPNLCKKCESCGFCARVCPRYSSTTSELETFVFGRERRSDEPFGIYQEVCVARATDTDVLKVCQDGGAVTALLLHAFKCQFIDGAVVSGVDRKKPFYPVAKLALTPEEVLRCSGTRYSCSPNLPALAEALKQERTSLAFVGTPCQIQAVRKMQMLGLRLAAHVKLLIGLMCTECFSYEGLMEKLIGKKLGVDLGEVKSMNIKGKIIVTLKSGASRIISLSEAKEYAQKGCALCSDFSSELADVSAGGLGLEGSTLIVIRTKEGKSLVKSAEREGVLIAKPPKKDEPALNLLVRLSARKYGSKATR